MKKHAQQPQPKSAKYPQSDLLILHKPGGSGRPNGNPKWRKVNLTATAAAMGISKSHLSLILKGTGHPSLPVALKVSAAFGIPIEKLCVPAAKKKR